MQTIAIVNDKGGVGKTTVAINLAATLAKEGRRTLVVDLDPQGHCAVGMAVTEEKIDRGIGDCLAGSNGDDALDVSDVIWKITPNLDLAPATGELVEFDVSTDSFDGRRAELGGALESVRHRYEFCVVDCPAHLGILTASALMAADLVIVPVETGYFSLHDLDVKVERFAQIGAANGQRRRVRILPNLYDVRTKMAREMLAELRRLTGDLVFRSVINFNTKLKESAGYGQTITEFAPGSMGAKDFQTLAEEILADAPAVDEVSEAVEAVSRQLAHDSDRLLATARPLIVPADPQPKRAVAHTARSETPARTARAVGQAHDARTEEERIEEKLEAIYGVRQVGEQVIFRTHSPGARVVQLAGDFNRWAPQTTPMRAIDRDGTFEAAITLPAGRYRYRLVVDGNWSYDRDNPALETNENGEVNSVVEVC